jgi:predicted small integral membrane protein
VYRVLVGNPVGKETTGKTQRRWEDNIKMDLQEVVYVGIDWIGLVQERNKWMALVNAVMNLRVP